MKYFLYCALILPTITQVMAQESPQLVLGTGHTGGVNGVRVPSNRAVVWTAGRDKTVRCWNQDLTRETARLAGVWHDTTAWDLSADGKQLVLAYQNGNVKLFDTAKLEAAPKALIFSGQASTNRYIRKMIFSRDGSLLVASAGQSDSPEGQTELQIWNVPTGTAAGNFQARGTAVDHLAVTDANTIMTANRSGEMVEYTRDGAVKGRSRLPVDGVLSSKPAALSPTGDVLLADNFRLFDTKRGTLKARFTTSQLRPGRIEAGALSLDNKLVVGATDILRAWAGTGGPELYSLFNREDPIESLALSLDGTRLVTGHASSAVHIRDGATGEIQHTLLGGPAPWDTLQWVGQEIVVQRQGQTTRWNSQNAQPGPGWTDPNGEVTAVALSPNGAYQAMAVYRTAPAPVLAEGQAAPPPVEGAPVEQLNPRGEPKLFAEVRVSNTKTKELLWSKTDSTDGWIVNKMVFSEDGNTLVCGGTRREPSGGGTSIYEGVSALQTTTGEKDDLFFLQNHKIGNVQALSISKDGHQVFAQDGTNVYAWELPSGVQVLKAQLPALTEGRAAMRRDGKQVAALTPEGWNLWELGKGKVGAPKRRLTGLTNGSTLAFTGEGALMVGDAAGKIHLWSPEGLLEEGNAVITQGDGFALTNLKPAPHGKLLAATGSDGRLRVWDDTARLRATLVLLPPAEGKINWISFTPTGQFAASPSAEKLLWWQLKGQLLPGASHADTMRKPQEVARALAP